jgi:hypothetical protein
MECIYTFKKSKHYKRIPDAKICVPFLKIPVFSSPKKQQLQPAYLFNSLLQCKNMWICAYSYIHLRHLFIYAYVYALGLLYLQDPFCIQGFNQPWIGNMFLKNVSVLSIYRLLGGHCLLKYAVQQLFLWH